MSGEDKKVCFQQVDNGSVEMAAVKSTAAAGSQSQIGAWCGVFALTAASLFAARGLYRSTAWSAVVLGLRSRLFRRAPIRSVRTDVVEEIRETLRLRKLHGFLVVTGESGVGKTVAIQTATEKFVIFLFVSVTQCTNEHSLFSNLCRLSCQTRTFSTNTESTELSSFQVMPVACSPSLSKNASSSRSVAALLVIT